MGIKGALLPWYYDSYCYLPLYIFCDQHVLCARLPTADQGCFRRVCEGVAAHRTTDSAALVQRWPQTLIVVRVDSGSAANS